MIFELQVWHRTDQSCFFLLQWQSRTQQLTASLPYSREVQQCYQRWQQRYLRYYEFAAPRISESGSLKPGTGDPAHDLMQAEQELRRSFQNWLTEGETRKIQQQLWEECSRLSHSEDRSVQTIELFLTIESPDLARLPWEAWELTPPKDSSSIRVIRTAIQGRSRRHLVTHPKKPRILVILGEDANLSLQSHWQALQPLKSLARLHRLTWDCQESAVAIKDRILQTIGEESWNVLVFVGHSQEAAVTGGRMVITPQVVLATNELETALTKACDRGLQLAIFNSCSGLDIAQSLVQLGLQVVAMREPIRADVAQQFLQQLCQGLAQHQTIPSAVQSACQHLQSTQSFIYPSAALLPILFSPVNTPPYQFTPPRWQQWLWQPIFSQSWLLTPLEAAILFIMLLLSGRDGVVAHWLLDIRYLNQAIYYDVTHQLPPSPVLLIGIDQASIDRAKTTLPNFVPYPMDRRYLAQIVAQTAHLKKATVIGVDYFLDVEQPHEQQLTQAIEAIVAAKQTWFVFAVKDQGHLYDGANRLHWSLKGDVSYHYPSSRNTEICTELCPFTYLLAIANLLSQPPYQTTAPQPDLNRQTDFQEAVSSYLNTWKYTPRQSPIAPFARFTHLPPLGLSIVTNYALPPNTFIPAWKFLEQSKPDSNWVKTVDQSIILIASLNYQQADDNFSAYYSTQYWCHQQNPQGRDCTMTTGGETIAQTLRDLLTTQPILRIPDRWLILLAAILTKSITLTLGRRSRQQHRRLIILLLATTGLYGVVSLQIYISAAVLIPWLLPSLLGWTYLGLALKRK